MSGSLPQYINRRRRLPVRIVYAKTESVKEHGVMVEQGVFGVPEPETQSAGES